MRIASAAVQMDASHTKQQSHEIKVAVRSIAVNRSTTGSESGESQAGPSVVLSESGKALQSGEAEAIQQSIDDSENDPKLRLIRSLVAMLTGKEIKSLTASAHKLEASALVVQTPSTANAQTTPAQSASPSSATVVEYSRRESYSESEQTSFSAAGVLNTADG